LAGRYWDLADPDRVRTLQSWEQSADGLVRIIIEAEQVRRYG
jgi:hypothetical protein